MENIQQNVPVVRQMHQVNDNIGVVREELTLNDGELHSCKDNHARVTDHLSNDPLAIDEDMSEIDGNQDPQVMAHQANLLDNTTGVMGGDKNLKLDSFSNQQSAHDLQLGSIGNGGGSLPIDTQNYYESLHSTPIMVYGVPAGSIVPFDSLVSVPLNKGLGEKQAEDELLQSPVTETVYAHSAQDMSQSLYVLHQPQKKGTGTGTMVMDQINASDVVSPNIVLESRDGNSFSKVSNHSNMVPSGAEFSLISTSCYDNSVTTVANIAGLSMSAVYHSPTETDSEVALTLASLGNPKIDKMNSLGKECNQNHNPEQSDVKACSVISSVADHHQFENLNHQANNMHGKEIEEKKQKPTLVLRSRRSRGTMLNQHHDLPVNDVKKVSKRRRKKETKSTSYLKVEESDSFFMPSAVMPEKSLTEPGITEQNESQKENLLGQLLKASEHCEPATLIPEGVVDDVIPAVGYRIMDMTNLSEMIRMMHKCQGSMGAIVIQEQASLREGAVSQLSVICTGCQEGAVCATSTRMSATGPWDINARVEQLTSEFNIKEDQLQRMLEILGIFYRPCIPSFQPVPPPVEMEPPPTPVFKKKRRKKAETDSVGKPKNLVCTVCKERFAGENHLKKHMHSHDLLLHTCPYCHAYFKKPFNLKQHIRKHENYKYECSQCQRSFTDKSTLLCHVRSQHEKRFDIECEICLKRFYHRAHYNEHMRLHTGEKPYMCELCGKKFSWHDSVKKHMQTHSAESKYKCRLCGKWFRWLQGVRQHLQQQHKLKKCDVEAQVVTAATETATGVPQFHHQPHPPPPPMPPQQVALHPPTETLNQPSQVLQHANPQEDNPPNREYHTLEAAAPNEVNASQQTLNIFHVTEVEGHQQGYFSTVRSIFIKE
ncbi:uncharacterized protein [Macrobrachium rosenbergii]|uniref:uncharacterized protein n=1 Tax=Macrobrachium rosenbergii TaxID=79674 RepID=UPI0034D6A292